MRKYKITVYVTVFPPKCITVFLNYSYCRHNIFTSILLQQCISPRKCVYKYMNQGDAFCWYYFLVFFLDLISWLIKYFSAKWANRNCHIKVDKGISYSGSYYVKCFLLFLKLEKCKLATNYYTKWLASFPNNLKLELIYLEFFRFWSPGKIPHPELNIYYLVFVSA